MHSADTTNLRDVCGCVIFMTSGASNFPVEIVTSESIVRRWGISGVKVREGVVGGDEVRV